MIEQLQQTFQPLMPAISFIGSAGSVGVTGYFWFVRMNRERPRLDMEVVEHLSFIDVGHCTSDECVLCFRMGIVVVNESSMPNAVLGASVSAMPRRSGRWRDVENVRPARGSAFPLNLPALQSGLLTIEWNMAFPSIESADRLEDPDQIVAEYLRHYWEFPDRVVVSIRGLRNRMFTETIPLVGSRMSATIRTHLELQNA